MGSERRERFTSADLDFTKFRELTEDIISADADVGPIISFK